MQFVTLILSLHNMPTSMWDENNYMHFLQPCPTPFIDKSTLCSTKMKFAPQLMLSLLTQCKQIYFIDLAQLKVLVAPLQLKPKKGAMLIDTPLINSSFHHSRYLGAYINMMCFYKIVSMLFGASKGQRVVLFLSWLLFFVKIYHLCYKECKHSPS